MAKEKRKPAESRPTKVPDSLLPDWEKMDPADKDYVCDTTIIRTRRFSLFVNSVKKLVTAAEKIQLPVTDLANLAEVQQILADIRRIFPELVPWRQIPELAARYKAQKKELAQDAQQ